MEKKLQKICLKYYSLLVVQDLWQADYQILSIMFMKEFIELNVNTDKMIKSVKHMELDISIATAFLNTPTLEMIWWNANVCVLIKVINESLTKSEKKDFLIDTNFLTTAIISLFYCCEKVFILLNIWMIGKDSMIHHYLKKKIL